MGAPLGAPLSSLFLSSRAGFSPPRDLRFGLFQQPPKSYPDTSQLSCKVHLRWNCYSPQRDQDEGKPAAASGALFAAAVAARMTASPGVRVPAAETLAAAKAFRGMAASKALRRVPAAKHRAARARRLARRSRKALAQRGSVRRLSEIAALIACARRSITGLLPA